MRAKRWPIEVLPVRANTIAIDDRPAVRHIGVVVVDDPSAAVPVVTPMVPSPAKAGEGSNPEAESESDPGTIPKKSRIRIPTGEDGQGIPIHEPGIVLGHVHYLGRRRLNDDRIPIAVHGLLGRSLQVSGLLGPLPHGLNRLIQVLGLVDPGIAQFGSPGEILIHVGEHLGELR
jgi:hypothetical protein